ncbi:Helix-turn-helix domain-containing protein OS=Kitasatospora aureofaciens OX=1894 GN=GCM10010502_74140 PE=4 SV=1 [Kitasatospora aureofaciens]
MSRAGTATMLPETVRDSGCAPGVPATGRSSMPATRFPAAWLGDRDLTGDLIRVVTLVQDYGWKSGSCFAADGTIGRQLGLSRGGVNRLIAKAKAKNLVRTSRNPATRTMNRRVRPLADGELAVCISSYARTHLAGTRFKVYAFLSLRQHFPEPTPVGRIARECRIKEGTARDAVAELLAQGWVSRGPGERRVFRYVVHPVPVPVRVPDGQPGSPPNGDVPALRAVPGAAADSGEVSGTAPAPRRGASFDVWPGAAGSVTTGLPGPVTSTTPDSVAETRSFQHDLLNKPAVAGGWLSNEPPNARTRGRAAAAMSEMAGTAGRGGWRADREAIRLLTDEQRRWGRRAASSALSRLPSQLAERLTGRQLEVFAWHIVATFADYGTSPEAHGEVILRALESAWEFARRREPVGAEPWSSVISPLPWLIRVVDRASETVTGARPVRAPECALCRGPLIVRDTGDPSTCWSCGPAAAAAACRRLQDQWESSASRSDVAPAEDARPAQLAPTAAGRCERSEAEGDVSEGTLLRRRLAARRFERERARARLGDASPVDRTTPTGPPRQGAATPLPREDAGQGPADRADRSTTEPCEHTPETIAAQGLAPRRDLREPDAGGTTVFGTARPEPGGRPHGTRPVSGASRDPAPGCEHVSAGRRQQSAGQYAAVIAGCPPGAGAFRGVSRATSPLHSAEAHATTSRRRPSETARDVTDPTRARWNLRGDGAPEARGRPPPPGIASPSRRIRQSPRAPLPRLVSAPRFGRFTSARSLRTALPDTAPRSPSVQPLHCGDRAPADKTTSPAPPPRPGSGGLRTPGGTTECAGRFSER